MSIEFITADSLEWLPVNRDQGSIITSLPDIDELGMTNVDEYKTWFQNAAIQCLRAVSPSCPCIFFQTDRKWKGSLISKSHALVAAAQMEENKLLWHKIVLRRGVGGIDLHRPGYSHLIAFGDDKAKPGVATPDVIHAGDMLYKNAMGANAVNLAVGFAAKASNRVLDPFCGVGTVPIQAAKIGLSARGIDIDAGQITKAIANAAK